MGTVDATIRPIIDVEAVAHAAKQGPVTVMAGGKEAFVVVDPDRFRDMLEADQQRRAEAWARMVEAMDRIAAKVAEDMTPEEIAALEKAIIDED